MPTTRPRHLITETDQIAAALDDAQQRWPEDGRSRARLIVRLVEEGHRVLRDEEAQRRAEHRRAVLATAGALTGCYGTGYLERLRDDWPA